MAGSINNSRPKIFPGTMYAARHKKYQPESTTNLGNNDPNVRQNVEVVFHIYERELTLGNYSMKFGWGCV